MGAGEAGRRAKASLRVQVTRTFEAPRERVFRAFVDKEALEVWFVTPVLKWLEEPLLEARPGGAYRWTVGDGSRTWCIHGKYLEVKPPERLVFTWRWENDPIHGESGDTLVTVEFHARGERTEVVLTHEGLPSEVSLREHDEGWAECLEKIGLLAGADRAEANGGAR
jgi:uncharacterized protein YndB with AHSA1/START domain